MLVAVVFVFAFAAGLETLVSEWNFGFLAARSQVLDYFHLGYLDPF